MKKVFGIGMSRTGTTTLGRCFEILGFTPHIGFDAGLKRALEEDPTNVEKILHVAEHYNGFEDSPWYHLYEELDQRFPGSKFILTVRKDSETQARSTWRLGVEAGKRTGECPQSYIAEKKKIYEEHNKNVLNYFKDRPEDLLVLCWENGDGWQEICSFLNVPVPSQPIPHANRARKNVLWNATRNSWPVQFIREQRRRWRRRIVEAKPVRL